MNMWMVGSFLVGFLLAYVVNSKGPLSLAMARRRGFWIGWEAREGYPEDALPRTRSEANAIIAEHDDKMARMTVLL